MFGSGLMQPRGPGTIPSDQRSPFDQLGLDASLGPSLQMPAPQAQPKKKGGMFGSGLGLGEAIVAALNGYLAGTGNPVGMANMQMMAHQRQRKHDQAAEEEQYQRHRQDNLADYAEQQKIQAQYGAPHINDTEEDFNFIAQQIGPDAAKEYLRNKTIAPPMMVPGPNGQMFMVPRAMPQQQSGPQPGQIEDGFQFIGGDPADKNNWKPAGGPTPQASGGFR